MVLLLLSNSICTLIFIYMHNFYPIKLSSCGKFSKSMVTRSKYLNNLMMFPIYKSVFVTKECSAVPLSPPCFSPKGQRNAVPRVRRWVAVVKADKLGWQEIIDLLGFFFFFLGFLVYFFFFLFWKPPPLESIFSFSFVIEGEVPVPSSYGRSHTLPLYIWKFKEAVAWVTWCLKKIISEIK